jgi:hypothetical protein
LIVADTTNGETRIGQVRHNEFVSSSPFESLVPADDGGHAEWVVAGLTPPPGVGFRVPIGFDSIARLHHPLADGRRWSEAVPAHEGAGVVEAAGEAPDAEEGRLDAGTVDLLVPLLVGATSTPGETHFALWLGWGDLRPGAHMILYSTGGRLRPWSAIARRLERARIDRARAAEQRPVAAFMDRCARLDWWGGRDMALFDGPVERVATIGTPVPLSGGPPDRLQRRSPQWWWPSDRAWFLATEIDDQWTYVAGPTALTDAILRLDLDAVIVDHTDAW